MRRVELREVLKAEIDLTMVVSFRFVESSKLTSQSTSFTS